MVRKNYICILLVIYICTLLFCNDLIGIIGAEPINNRSRSIQLDIQYLRANLPEKEWITLEKYYTVLAGYEKFQWQNSKTDEIKEIDLNTFHKYLCGEQAITHELQIDKLSIHDLDNDDLQELILNFSDAYGHFLVLHKEGAKYYGSDFVYRGFIGLQQNGIFSGSGGARNIKYHRLKFQNEKFVKILLAEIKENEYYINGMRVSEIDYLNWVHHNITSEVNWYNVGI